MEEVQIDSDESYDDDGYPCDICWKVFKHATNLYRHKKQHTVRPLFVCSKCKLSYLRKDSLRKHLKKGKCNKENVGWVCDKCPKVYQHKSSYNRHLKTHEDSGESDEVGRTDSGEDEVGPMDSGEDEVGVVESRGNGQPEIDIQNDKTQEMDSQEVRTVDSGHEDLEMVYDVVYQKREAGHIPDFTDSEDEDDKSVVPGTPCKEPDFFFLGSSEFPVL